MWKMFQCLDIIMESHIRYKEGSKSNINLINKQDRRWNAEQPSDALDP